MPRPKTLKEFHGQDELKPQIELAIEVAKKTREAVGHILISGQSGLGKTSLAQVVANERGVDSISVLSTSVRTQADILGLFESLNSDGYVNDSPDPVEPENIKPTVLFIDEIHRLPIKICEQLYSAMEDRTCIEERKDPWSKAVRKVVVWVPKFTLIGATTHEGLLPKPFLNRFKYHWKVKPYSVEECKFFAAQFFKSQSLSYDEDALTSVAIRSRGTARVAVLLSSQVADVFILSGKKNITGTEVEEIFAMLDVDTDGLREMDRKILVYLHKSYRPTGIQALASAIGEEPESVETHYEPYLVQKGFIMRTPGGRIITEDGVEYLRKKGVIQHEGRRILC